jgi:flagellar hook assembly protein FlgD
LANGARLEGSIPLAVVGARGAGPVSVSSNPLAAGGVITLRTARGGRVSARLFDARGRLVRTLAEEPAAAPGDHDLAFDGRGDQGAALPSGIYFIRVETPEGVSTSRIAVLK